MGSSGRTRLETVHWTLASGEIASVRVHTVVNATSDPAVAERLLAGNLNWVQPAGSDELQQVTAPVIFHDEARRLFVLVLPEAFRGRELEERAAFLTRLSKDATQPMPRYVLHFEVVFSVAELEALLSRSIQGEALPVEEPALEAREDQIVAREAALAEWEARLTEQEKRLALDLKQRELLDAQVSDSLGAELRRKEQDIARREAELREVERLVLERQAELERQERAVLHQPRAVTDPDTPTRVAQRESMERAAREAEELVEDAELLATPVVPVVKRPIDQAPALEEVASEGIDTAVRSGSRAAERIEPEADLQDPFAEDLAAFTGRTPQTVATPLSDALLAAVAEESDKRRSVEEGFRLDSDPPQDAQDASDVPGEVSGEHPALPEDLAEWYEEGERHPRWYLRDSGVHLAACLPAEEAEAFVGVEPQGLLQLHRFDSFAWVTLAVVASGGAEARPAVHWPLDVRDDRARELLDRLAADFRFSLEVYDELLEPVTVYELHYSLEENVRVVRERAQQCLSDLTAERIDPVAAWEAFCAPGYHRLEEGALDFGPNAFQQMQSAVEVADAVALVATWSVPDMEDDLLLRRSFPAAAWRSLRLRVLRQALEFGIWMDRDLRRMALDAGYATSRRDLLRACLAGFERVGVGELESGLDPIQEEENWHALLAEAEALGVPVEPRWEALAERARVPAVEPVERPGLGGTYTDQLERLDEADLIEAEELEPSLEGDAQEPGEVSPEVIPAEGDLRFAMLERDIDERLASPEPEVASPGAESAWGSTRDGMSRQDSGESAVQMGHLSSQELVALLREDAHRVDAALALCHREEMRFFPDIFAMLPDMGPRELQRLAPSLVGLGQEAVPFFLESLRASGSLPRATSALALGALRAEEAIEPMIDLLLDEPTDQWRNVATALGDLGKQALMSLASRIRHSSEAQKERIAIAMAEVAFWDGTKERVVDLSGSRDEEAARVATLALDRLVELQLLWEDRDPLPALDQPGARFARRLMDAMPHEEGELVEDDIIEAEDIVEENDVLGEELADQRSEE